MKDLITYCISEAKRSIDTLTRALPHIVGSLSDGGHLRSLKLCASDIETTQRTAFFDAITYAVFSLFGTGDVGG